jgi:hypothetical protein
MTHRWRKEAPAGGHSAVVDPAADVASDAANVASQVWQGEDVIAVRIQPSLQVMPPGMRASLLFIVFSFVSRVLHCIVPLPMRFRRLRVA